MRQDKQAKEGNKKGWGGGAVQRWLGKSSCQVTTWRKQESQLCRHHGESVLGRGSKSTDRSRSLLCVCKEQQRSRGGWEASTVGEGGSCGPHSELSQQHLFPLIAYLLPCETAYTHTSYKMKFPVWSLVTALLPKDKILIPPFLKFYKPWCHLGELIQR